MQSQLPSQHETFAGQLAHLLLPVPRSSRSPPNWVGSVLPWNRSQGLIFFLLHLLPTHYIWCSVLSIGRTEASASLDKGKKHLACLLRHQPWFSASLSNLLHWEEMLLLRDLYEAKHTTIKAGRMDIIEKEEEWEQPWVSNENLHLSEGIEWEQYFVFSREIWQE